MCKEVASSKKNEFKTRVQKSVPYLWPQWRQNGYNRYPIYDQNGWKTIPFGAAHTYIAHIREYPPPRASIKRVIFFRFHFTALLQGHVIRDAHLVS